MNSLEKIEKVDQSLSLSLGDINLNISAIENKLVDVQKLLNTKNEDLKTFLFTEIEKSILLFYKKLKNKLNRMIRH